MRPILTAAERVAAWHTAVNPEDYGSEDEYNAAVEKERTTPKKLYHLTDRANFKLKPQFHPQNNTTLGGDWPEAGIFLGDSPERWVNGYGYWRPYVAEFEAPGDIKQREGVFGGGYGGETFIPSRHFKDIKLNRVIPLDAYAREEYGDHGWMEANTGRDFETNEPIDTTFPHPATGYLPFRAFNGDSTYQYQGDVRDRPPEWRKDYQQRFRKFRNEKLRDRENAGA